MDVESLVETAAQRLARGLSLEDLDGVLLAYSSNQSHADRVRVNFLLSKRVPADVNAWQQSHGIAAAVRPVVVPANPELGMLGRVCVPLLVRGFRVGYLWVQQDEDEPTAADILAQLPRVRDLLDLLASLLLDSNTAESEARRRTEAEFLAACRGDSSAAAAVLEWPQIHPRKPWQLVTVVDATDSTSEALAADPLAAALIHRSAGLQATIGLQPALFSAGTQTHSVMLFQDSPGRAPHAAVLVRYALELAKRSGRKESRVVMGLSEAFSRPRELADAYVQSTIAAQAGVVDPALGELVDARDAGVFQILGRSSWDAELSVHFRTLDAADTNAELLPMLELLYDNDGSVASVASALHLHRSSIYNRLGRIRMLIGADPLHGRVRLELHLALKSRRWAARPRLQGT